MFIAVNEAYKQLVIRYANGRRICNCGEAYCDERGTCPHGCSANLITVKHEIAQRVIAELELMDRRSEKCQK